jgi:hypothetical protein
VSETEGFLSRWARRKRAAATSLEAEIDEAIAASATRAPAPTETPAAGEAAQESKADAPTIDLSALPAIESITAATDIRPFLAPGVPVELTRAALRRAWATDPQVRDFVGLAENQWDFTDPSGVPGFGPIGSPDDVRRIVAALLGEDRGETANMSKAPEAAHTSHPADRTASSGAAAEQGPDTAALAGATPEEAAKTSRSVITASSADTVAMQKSGDNAPAETVPVRRAHGGALPR